MPKYWLWGFISVASSLGGWIYFYGVGIVYVLLTDLGLGSVANAGLPLACSFSEMGFVYVLQKSFTWWVYGKYKKTAGTSLEGILCSNIALVHVYAESVKLVATVSMAAYCEETGLCDPYGWITSIYVSLVVATLSRYGWARFLVTRLLRIMSKKVAKELRPTAITKVHDEVRYLVGYIRFIVATGICLGNLIRGREDVLFNSPALWCLVASFAAELTEDLLVYLEVFPYPPAPAVEQCAQMDNFHPEQLYAFSSEELGASISTRRKSGKKAWKTGVNILATDGDYFPRSLFLHGTRELTIFEMVHPTIVGSFFSLCLFQLVLGAGYVAGVCPLPLVPADRFKEALLWPLPLNICSYG